MFDTQLSERDAYRAVFAFGGMLSGLDTNQVSNIAAAIPNARLFTNETVAQLKTKAPASKIEEAAWGQFAVIKNCWLCAAKCSYSPEGNPCRPHAARSSRWRPGTLLFRFPISTCALEACPSRTRALPGSERYAAMATSTEPLMLAAQPRVTPVTDYCAPLRRCCIIVSSTPSKRVS